MNRIKSYYITIIENGTFGKTTVMFSKCDINKWLDEINQE